MRICVEAAKSISIDFWIDLVDLATDDLLKHSILNFWYIHMSLLASTILKILLRLPIQNKRCMLLA
jgi:hypothetical protein